MWSTVRLQRRYSLSAYPWVSGGRPARLRPISLPFERAAGVPFLRVNEDRPARPVADDLDHHFLSLGAVEVVSLRRMLHVAAGLEGDGLRGIEGVSDAGVPGAREDDRMAVFRMVVWPGHVAGRELDA